VLESYKAFEVRIKADERSTNFGRNIADLVDSVTSFVRNEISRRNPIAFVLKFVGYVVWVKVVRFVFEIVFNGDRTGDIVKRVFDGFKRYIVRGRDER